MWKFNEMNRFKRHTVKREKTEPSASFTREAEEHDLAYYIHDRVELMHQVFSVLKHRELRAIAPECVRHISSDDLQELCTEELLGISSKRLCAILDGAEPPSDTESSSQSEPERLETISLDSISSDDEILSQGNAKKKKHKHRRRDSKSKSKKKRTKSTEPEAAEDAEKSKASRAGLTVLELLELQARARAIRAQLQQEQAKKQAESIPVVDHNSSASENEVEIKEEPPEVVEISSDDEKPKIEELEKALPKANNDANENGVEPKATNKNSEKEKEANKSKEKKNKKDKSKKNKKKDTENKKKDQEKHNKKSSEKRTNNLERDESDLRKVIENEKDKSPELSREVDNTQKVTKKINDLIITVPQQHPRKIRLNRNKVTVSVTNNVSVTNAENPNRNVSVMSSEKITDEIKKPIEATIKSAVQVMNKPKEKVKDKSKKKHKRKERNKSSDKDTSDHDEITLQLSDSEKMDLLEDFDRRDLDKVTSSSDDSDSSSDSDSESSQDSSKDKTVETPMEEGDDKKENDKHDLDRNEENKAIESENKSYTQNTEESTSKDLAVLAEDSNNCADNDEKCKNDKNLNEQNEIQVTNGCDSEKVNNHNAIITDTPNNIQGFISSNGTENNLVVNNIDDIPIQEDILEPQNTETDKETTKTINKDEISKTEENPTQNINQEKGTAIETSLKYTEGDTENTQYQSTERPNEINDNVEIINTTQDSNTNLSEGEVSSNESSEVEACELKPEVVCISDEESDCNKSPKKKKHKKKEKKSKKEKKTKKSKSDFREGADQNFYSNINTEVVDIEEGEKMSSDKEYVSLIDDDEIYEILESSDELSCNEVECTLLSKEPTAEEIEALSAKIDEIEREDVVTEEQIREHERKLIVNRDRNTNENNTENEYNSEDNLENISWKDRYLGSKKVKTVLTTSHILNALRKKNKELKKKLEESRKEDQEMRTIEEPTVIQVQNKELEEGSIEHYNTLQGSTKYVNPVPDPVTEHGPTETPENRKDKNNTEIQVTGEMKKDAKLLLKMYKKLLKYNDIKKPKDPNKKKKKKQKKKEKDANVVASSDVLVTQ